MTLNASQLAQLLNGTIIGNSLKEVNNIGPIETAADNYLSFFNNPKYEPHVYTTQAGVLLVPATFVPLKPVQTTLIQVADPYACIALILDEYVKSQHVETGISDKASIHANTTIGNQVYIGDYTTLNIATNVGDNTKIYEQCTIGKNVQIGQNCIIYPGVKLYPNTIIGNNCILHAGVVIGSDGFGFAPMANGSYKKVPHVGTVSIGNDVEIGANSTIDRGSIGVTKIGNGVKIDNLVHIAHNVEIGNNTVIAAQTGISGSTKIGDNCMIGGQVGIVGHITIASGTKINAQSGVSKSIIESHKAVTGSPAFNYAKSLRSQVIYKNLPQLEERIVQIEKQILESK
jgi:UDP-3-O-[3-hydroxymyristoyl] glucosamine N-acyltransferase